MSKKKSFIVLIAIIVIGYFAYPSPTEIFASDCKVFFHLMAQGNNEAALQYVYKPEQRNLSNEQFKEILAGSLYGKITKMKTLNEITIKDMLFTNAKINDNHIEITAQVFVQKEDAVIKHVFVIEGLTSNGKWKINNIDEINRQIITP